MSDVQLVVFDLGRVLIRICDGWRNACEVAGVPVPAGAGEFDESTKRRVDEIVGRLDSGACDLQTFAGEYGPCCGLAPADVVRIQQVYLRGPYPGAAELLDELTATGVQTACLSNTHDTHWRMMLDTASANYLPLERLTHRFASHLVGMRKPFAAIYEHVERTAHVAPGAILFFDDLEPNVTAARRRGWQGRIIRTDADPIAQVRHHLRDAAILR
jgi:glucose-1-phosphatase